MVTWAGAPACRPVPAPRPATASAGLAAAVPGGEALAAEREEPCAGPLDPPEGDDPELLADPLAPTEPPVSAAASPGIATIAAPIPRAAASAPTRPTINLGPELARLRA